MNKIIDKDKAERYFRVANFYLAVFLFTRGMELVNIERDDPKRSKFVFLDIPERENYIQSFNFSPEDASEVLVDARKFVMAIKTLKDKLYQGGWS